MKTQTKVSDIMTREVETVQSTVSLQEAAEKMRDSNVGALLVYAGKTLAGVVTDRDVTVKATAKGLDPFIAKVEDVMTWRVESCRDDTEIEYAARVMEAKGVHRLAVLDRLGALKGIVSVTDIATKTNDSELVERVVEATAAQTGKQTERDYWTSFDEDAVD